jgi:diaminopimelate epimerase
MRAAVSFTKMSGAGNDFIVLDSGTWDTIAEDKSAWVRGACRRGLSIGADGVLVIGPADGGRVRVAFFNPDGGEAFCGNGSRCAARYAAEKGMAASWTMTLATAAGDVPAVWDGDSVTLTLPPPVDRGDVALPSGTGTVPARWIVAGVPHLVISVEGIDAYPLARVAPAWRRLDALGPGGANVSIVEPDARGRVHIRTFERGVEGETLACGSGAVAAAFAARLGGASDPVTVVPASGIALRVDLPGDPRRPGLARLSGDARIVFEGTLTPDAIAEPS